MRGKDIHGTYLTGRDTGVFSFDSLLIFFDSVREFRRFMETKRRNSNENLFCLSFDFLLIFF